MNVLIVDDDRSILIRLTRWILQMGWNADIAIDGIIAVKKLRNTEYQLVITDLAMAGMTGIALYDHIKAEYGIPVLVMTAYPEFAIKELKFPYIWLKDGEAEFTRILGDLIETSYNQKV